ncbi:MAG: protein TolR [Acidobacteria bacterium]|nr:protein TolR [Acidobacteriota bacterium]NIM60126.1 protein TolR [Acidobacteriota bacterium]NIO57795.1 protein TolR [Acidobacteriota bacterium]NIQ28804.1 protein TolR [Acidobacteriota bacterium]NIQ83262.1 protein TolR [Acidobacteriota bacterium]
MQPDKQPKLNSSINVTPLVDVVLVLLIIFMVIAPQLNLDQAITLPKTQRPPDKPQNNTQIVVSITADGQLHVDDTPVAREQLPDELLARAAAIGEAQVVIKGDARLSFGHVQKTMFEIEAAGFKDVGLIARQSEG